MLIVYLAWRDLVRDKFFLFCNVAAIVGVLVPLLVLLGVKNGVYHALIGEMLANPTTRQIDTQGNSTFTQADLDRIRDWPEIAFMTPKVRSQFDYVSVRKTNGRRVIAAIAIPSGAGDPTLPEGLELGSQQFALSAQVARQLDIASGDAVEIITQAEGRPRQLVLAAEAVAVLPDASSAGAAVFVPFEMLDLIEAFYDSYSLPDHGIQGERALQDRVNAYEGIRVFARTLEDLAPLQSRLEAELQIQTSSRTQDVEALLGLGRKLDLALALTAFCASIGLAAALVIGFLADVARKRIVLASIALIGFPSRSLAVFPMIQAAVAGCLGLVFSFVLFLAAGQVADVMFGAGLPGVGTIAFIPLAQAAAICAAVMVLVLAASGISAWSAQRLDPATVLREGA
jgi:putative ABC transport system permease protein